MQQTEGDKKLHHKLQKRKENRQYRQLEPVVPQAGKHLLKIDGREMVNFCSNDYLGLSSHPELIHRSNQYTKYYGTGSSSSRLVSGSLQIHHELEEKIAGLYHRESALLFGSGFQANASLLPALTGRGDLILADKLSHNSILQGAMLSRAEFRRFRHNDLNHLEQLLKRYRSDNAGGGCWVVTESLFSMDGDRAPLNETGKLCRKYGARFMVDDAHAFGVWGENGLGLTFSENEVDIILGTLGKAGGGYGAFVISPEFYKDILVNYCTGIIYSTAPPPGLVGAADAAFDLIPQMEAERKSLYKNIEMTVERLKKSGYETGKSSSQIIPVLLDSEKQALDLSDKLRIKNLFVQAIRPPTVTRSRLRITLTALHTEEHIHSLTEAISND